MELTVWGPTEGHSSGRNGYIQRYMPPAGVRYEPKGQGIGTKGPGHSSSAMTGFGVSYGKVLILKIPNNI